MIFAHFVLDVHESNAFIVGCKKTREALLVDAGACDARFAPFLRLHELQLTTVFITHHHFDHTDGLAAVLDTFGAQPYSFSGNVGGRKTVKCGHGDTVRFGAIEGRVVHTPGHTPDGISLILPGMVFTGDALFAGSVGGTANDRDAQQQLDAIRKHIFTLADDYEIHVGHGPSSTVRVEREFNPFFN
ncbi:MAG: MBL fold metallo-hydrolase [Candidatus Hydrogenedentes bacterium]|nr:MBL fold metallo-hydrolase [Candidatus Hydrogenedentota bacterium]MBI3119570.1 MBL fold metallo-hydrolase [Candidatus Hydrogenedentota bacterium]